LRKKRRNKNTLLGEKRGMYPHTGGEGWGGSSIGLLMEWKEVYFFRGVGKKIRVVIVREEKKIDCPAVRKRQGNSPRRRRKKERRYYFFGCERKGGEIWVFVLYPSLALIAGVEGNASP